MPVTRAIDADSHIYLVDASGYIFRAYHALPPLTRKSDGLPVGAVSGFCNMLWKLLRDMKDNGDAPTHFACIFDKSSKTFRNDLDPRYKANRPPPPEDLVPQFPLVRDAAVAFGTPALEMEGFEADDLIATYARQAEAQGARVTIISSDKDLMQLVSDKIQMLDTMKDKRIGHEQVMEKFGVGPERVVDVQALAGDSVDNVPGVPGIGVKTAAQLINEFGDLEKLLEGAETIKQNKRRENLIEFAHDARLSKQLVTLATDAPTPLGLDELGVEEPNPETLLPFLEKMEFRTITKRVQESLGGAAATNGDASGAAPSTSAAPQIAPFNADAYETVTTIEALEKWADRARLNGYVAVDTETDSLNPVAARLVGVSLATAPNEACYIPLGHQGGDLLGDDTPDQISLDNAISILKPLFEDPAVLKIGQNLKYDISILHPFGVEMSPIDDTMLLSFVTAAGKRGHGMDELSQRYFEHTPIPFKQVAGTGKSQITFDKVPVPDATKYAAEDADVTLRLWQALKPEIVHASAATLYETIERPIIPVVAEMERAGVKVDREFLSRLSGDFAQRMAALEAEAHELAGQNFNLGSPKQIGEILFGELGMPGGKKTKTGAWSTGADTLEDLAAEGHELPRVILNWRMLSKLKSTYTDALSAAADPSTGRVHTSFSLVGAQTGRLSSTDPNLQNIPIRTEEGRKIREAFIAEPGNVLIAADYSQIELRLLAHIAEIDALRDAFKSGLDIHAMTASEMFGDPIEGMDPMVRRRAKAINFGIIYGISAFGLARQLAIPRGEAADYIKAYFEKFPGIKGYMDQAKAFAREKGYVETAFGRRVWVEAINSKKGPERGFAERQAINAPIQGSAADVIKRAMIRMPGALKDAGLQAKMLLQVHDELLFEAPEAEADATIDIVRNVMMKAPLPARDISVPLVVDARAAKTWGQAH
ncbi:MAG: DNA polymerase I [Pseudomonadota bacterium]